MTYEQKDGEISVFKNKEATPENQKPPYTGTAKIDGKEYRVSLWVNTSKSGLKYFGGKIQLPKDDWQKQGETKDESVEFEDEIPF